MFVLRDPFFWALVSMFALVLGVAMMSLPRLGRSGAFGSAVIAVNDLARIALVLPFCSQPRFDWGVWNWVAGGVILAAAVAFGAPALSINWRTAPKKDMTLKTNGIYRVVRNPIYLADVLAALGFAVMFGSYVGAALTPVWWAAFLSLVLVEEAALERTLGQPYRDYKRRVRGRIIPGLPV